MSLDLTKFYQACNPKKIISFEKADDRLYYIDFASVRGGTVINELARTITRLAPDESTCQLFTGHIGGGKSTELLRLKFELQQQNFQVIYFDSREDLAIGDVDVTDVLLAIACQITENLEDTKVALQPKEFKSLLQRAVKVLQTEIELETEASVGDLGITASTEGEFSLSLGIAKITAKTKNSPELRSKLRQFLEPRTYTLLEQINKELLEPAITQLKQQGKRGLVVIIDSLDRLDNVRKSSRSFLPEYLFVERGEQLKGLNCHVVYSIPLSLIFSKAQARMSSRFGTDPKLLPMVRVRSRDGSQCKEGMEHLRQMVLARAFPDIEPQNRLTLVTELFDVSETLDRLCWISGGHVRELLTLLYGCIQQQEQPPLSRQVLENVIRRKQDALVRAVTDKEWTLLRQVKETQLVQGEEEYQTLLRSLFVFEYQDERGGWFDINPILEEAPQFSI